MSKILMVASEATPFAKTGGLADVLGALPQALAARGEEVAVVLPHYRHVEGAQRAFDGLRIYSSTADIWLLIRDGVRFYFVDCPPLFHRAGIYMEAGKDYPDNHIRFGVLCQAAIAVSRWLFQPEIIHYHDWQGSLVAPLIRTALAGDPTFFGVQLLLTIHNLGYQGHFPRQALTEAGLGADLFRPGIMEFYGGVNLLKGGIVFADAINTVSKGYAREIQTPEYGFGLDGLLRSRSDVLSGIINGVDYTEWNPEHDPFIAAHFSSRQFAGKQACKRDLLEALGLPLDNMTRPLIGIVSRFAGQKGFDLIESAAGELMKENLCLAVLGTGEQRYEELFRSLAVAFPDRVGVRIEYNEVLAHKIEAGADMFLMPSRYEPCGLNQIYSLRYGTVPIVRATGGLDDTIKKGTGFKFQEYAGFALLEAVRAALAVFGDPDVWKQMMRNGMAQDYSWDASAVEYSALYERLRAESFSSVRSS
jgi:starch synthase